MADRHHYVSQFQLREFTDPSAEGSPDPWLWIGNCADGEIKRRSPGNIGWERGLYDVPGALSAAGARLEDYMATRIEAPAALALREFSRRSPGARGSIPMEVMRYVAWSAARTPTMRSLYQAWIDNLPDVESPAVEPPLEWLDSVTDRNRLQKMEHSAHGVREDVRADEVTRLKTQGWRFVVTDSDFGELLHVQAHYFFERFFPRMQWLILDAPLDQYFIIGDRPVVWGFNGALEVPPAALRSPMAQVVAPLTRSLALLAYNAAGERPERVKVEDCNQAVVLAAQDWIAGPTEEAVIACLTERRLGSARRAG